MIAAFGAASDAVQSPSKRFDYRFYNVPRRPRGYEIAQQKPSQNMKPTPFDATWAFLHRRTEDLKLLEHWRVVPSNTNYLVSDHGRVVRTAPGKGTQPGRVLKPGITRDGYEKVELFKDGIAQSRYVHRLVVEAFIGAIPTGMEVNHISGQKRDNRLTNLEVVTHAVNTKHAWDTGLRSRTLLKLAA